MLLFISIDPMKEINLKNSSLVLKGNKNGQLLKIDVSMSETAPLIKL
jgi:hypothetical protein